MPKIMSTLKLHQSGAAKYVILENATTKEKMLISEERAYYHREILRKVIMETNQQWNCIGGGRIKISPDNIHIYGYSVDFGTPNESDVKSILEDNQELIGNKSITYAIGDGY